MSFKDQQTDELMALEAIYADEYTLLTKDGEFPSKFTISVISIHDDRTEDEDVYSLILNFTIPEKYPETGPEIIIEEHSDNIDEEHEQEAMNIMNEMIPKLYGNVMIFDLVSKMHEWINQLKDKIKTERDDAEERRKRELAESQQKKFVGTRVTVETFMKWKQAFEAEMFEKTKRIKIEDSKRLTGKEMFLSDKALANSDLQFAEDDDGDVDANVDESLFADDEDLDELDPDFTISDEDDDDDDDNDDARFFD